MSTLDEMTRGITAGVMQRKADKATKLTPTAGERGTTVADMAARIPDVPEVFLTNEAVADIAKDLRTQAATLLAVAEALEARTGGTADAQPAQIERKLTKAEQRFAGTDPEPTEQQKFDGRMKELSAAAQAATFAAADDGDAVEQEAPKASATGAAWVCPKHGDQAIATISAKGGRKVRVCDKCDEVEPA